MRADELQLVSFRVSGRLYGIDIMQVHQVLQAGHPVPAPGMPEHILGMTEVRGRLIAVVDLARLLGLQAKTPPGRYLVVHLPPDRLVALAMDGVEARIRIPRADLLQRPEELTSPAVVGAFRAETELGLVLDPERLMGHDS